jgi:hypothetical protein
MDNYFLMKEMDLVLILLKAQIVLMMRILIGEVNKKKIAIK